MGTLLDHILDSHVLTLTILVVVAVGAIKSVAGDSTYGEFVDTVWPLVGAGAIGRGLAAYKK